LVIPAAVVNVNGVVNEAKSVPAAADVRPGKTVSPGAVSTVPARGVALTVRTRRKPIAIAEVTCESRMMSSPQAV